MVYEAAIARGSRTAPATRTPLGAATESFVDEVWSRPGLSRRNRRWITLTSVGAADAMDPIEQQVYDALNSGDITVDEMFEFVLHFAVYNGWPKASAFEGAVFSQWGRICAERGEEFVPFAPRDGAELGLNDWEERLKRGEQEFVEVNLIDAPPRMTPFLHAGILNFVFGHVWQRPGLSRRDRRFITVASVGVCDAVLPLESHVGAALESGDITKEEMDEVALQFAAYSGFAKGQALQNTADSIWAELSGTSEA